MMYKYLPNNAQLNSKFIIIVVTLSSKSATSNTKFLQPI